MKKTLLLIILVCSTFSSVAKNAVSEMMRIDCNGQNVDIRLTYPFTNKVEGVVLWVNDGRRDTFIADVAKRYYDVQATLRGSFFKTKFASAEYLVPPGVHAVDVAEAVVGRLKQVEQLRGLKFSLMAFGDECLVAARLCDRVGDDIAKVVLVSPLVDNSRASLMANRIYAATAAERVDYGGGNGDDNATDSLNRASSLDTEYSSDVLSRLLFAKQHLDPLDSIATTCHDAGEAMARCREYLSSLWDKEDTATKAFWRHSKEDYTRYFLRGFTQERIYLLQADMKKVYGGIACPVMYIYGKSDVTLDAVDNAAMMSEALRGRTGTKQVLLEGYDHELRQTLGQQAGAVDPEVVTAIVGWTSGHRLLLKTSRSKKSYERLKAFGLQLGGGS